MITSLTKEQEALIPVYYQEGLDIGHNTTPIDNQLAIQAVNEMCSFLGSELPSQYIFCDSPLACQQAWMRVQREAGIVNPTVDYEYFSPWRWGYLSYYQMYKYIRNELFPAQRARFPLLDQVLKWCADLHYVQINNGVAYISERPVVIKKNERGLHREDGMALEYKDGFGIYSLNGVVVEEEVVMTPAADLDLTKHLLKEVNAEKRREVFRKVGSEGVVQRLGGKRIDQFTMQVISGDVAEIFGIGSVGYEYELYEVNLGNGNIHPFLKMKNPSIDAEHFEAVPKGTKTCKEAIAFRNGLKEFFAPEALT
jgi:hypothetical protein